MSKIKSPFKRFLSEIYTASLCKKEIDSEVESKSDAELRVSEEMRNEEMRNQKSEIRNKETTKWETRNEELSKWGNEKWGNEKWGNEVMRNEEIFSIWWYIISFNISWLFLYVIMSVC